jgi:protein-S-isoprenylcysteine O-methyltransferase Ste14
VAAPALARAVEPLSALDGIFGHVVGIILFGIGLVGVFASQEAMRSSWRIGQDASERTELVTDGPFGYVRNPIFSSLVAVQAGIALLVPSVIALIGLAVLLFSIEVQVRLVEEPHLIAVHGDRYAQYGRRVGRFVPRLGRFGRGELTHPRVEARSRHQR